MKRLPKPTPQKKLKKDIDLHADIAAIFYQIRVEIFQSLGALECKGHSGWTIVGSCGVARLAL